jgi:hypothetical protein
MLIRLLIKFRPFSKISEKKDSGYFSGLDGKNKAIIDVNSDDDFLEQILTYFHELTHCAFDVLFKHKQKDKKETNLEKEIVLRDKWAKYISKTNKEERICQAVEKAVKKVLKKEIPKKFYREFFGNE